MREQQLEKGIFAGLGRKILLWFLILSLVPLTLVSLLSYLSARTSLIQDTTQHLTAVGELKKSYIESFFAERISNIELQSRLPVNIEFLQRLRYIRKAQSIPVQDLAASPAWQTLARTFRPELERFRKLYGYHDILFLDTEGNVLFSLLPEKVMGKNVFAGGRENSLFSQGCRKAMATGRTIITDMEFHPSIETSVDKYLIRAVIDEEGQLLGLMVLDISLDRINSILQDRTGLGETGETFLVGSDQLMRSDSWKEKGGNALRTEVKTELTRTWAAHLQAKGQAGHGQGAKLATAINYVSHRGDKVFGFFSELGSLVPYDLHWAVVSEVAESEALALVERFRLITTGLFLVTVLVVSLAAAYIARGIVLPIRQLSAWAGRMAEGREVAIQGEDPDNEIGVLRASFRRMVGSFQEITAIARAISEGDFHRSVPLRSDEDRLGKAVNQMVGNLQAVVRQAEVIAEGDFSVQITPWSPDDQLGTALLMMTSRLREMEEANRKALERARILTDHLNNLPIPVLTVDPNLQIQYLNNAALALTGLTSRECMGRRCYEMFHNEDCQTSECRIVRAMRTKQIETAETVIDPGGRNIPIRYTGAPIYDDQGTVIGALEYIIDITETRNAFQAIEKENWIQAGVALINDRLRGEQSMAQLCRNLLSGLAQRLEIPMAAMYVAEEQGAFSLGATYSTTGKAVGGEKFRAGEGLIGQAAREKRRLVVNDIPPAGIRLVSGLAEVSPRQLVAMPLIHEEQVKGVLELGGFTPMPPDHLAFLDRVAAPIAIAVTTVQSRVRLAELLERTQQQAMALQQQQEELRAANEELESQTSFLKERERELQAQHEELASLNEELEEKTDSLQRQKADIEEKNRQLQGAREDIEKKAEELAIASKYKSEFLANMSHELRTPLNSLLLLSHNLAKNKDGNLSEDQVESARIMYSSGNTLLELINEILDLSKIEAGRIDLAVGDVAFSDLAVRLQGNFQPMAAAKGLAFSVVVDRHAPAVLTTDRQRLEQILRNLVANAIKFTEKGGVTVTIRPLGEEDAPTRKGLAPAEALAIVVTDTGIGIPAEKQRIIFEAFQQVDGSISRKYGGTGLGLSISRELADLLGGEIQVTSSPGRGASFILYLPRQLAPARKERQAAPAPQETRRIASPPGARPATAGSVKQRPVALDDDREAIGEADKTVLIVEDDLNFMKYLIKQGREKGFKCLAAASGQDGLVLAEKYRPSAVILDINLPEMNGWEVLEALKKNPVLRHIPVHMMSVEEKTLDAFKKGAVGYLHKPVTQDDLRHAFEVLEDYIDNEIRELLVVEDDPLLRQEIVKLIGNGDVHTTALGSGAEVLATLRQQKFDCMILDIGLPDMTGFELLDRLEKERGLEIPPVIVYTGRELTREEHESLYRYTDSIIIKGVKSVERLLDETALFLHRVVDRMPAEKRRMIANLYEQDAMFAGKKVLIVDDDMRNAFALSKILAEKQMAVLIANTGFKALELLAAEEGVDLVLMDIMMPEMDGYEAIRRIRAQERFWNLPIIALTAKAMPEDKRKCLEAGANDYLAKPIEEARLFSVMRIWLYR